MVKLAVIERSEHGAAQDLVRRDQQIESVNAPEAIRAEGLSTARRGALLAVCGLTGGAGATTLAYLVAFAAARLRRGPVLVGDAGGPNGGMGLYARAESRWTLGDAAERLGAGLAFADVCARGPDDLRVLASTPRFERAPPPESVSRLLARARDAHELTVIDCGTLQREAQQLIASVATHIAWVLPATASAVTRAQRTLGAVPSLPARQLLVARRELGARKAPLRELKRLALRQAAALILVPYVPDLTEGGFESALDCWQVPVQAILGALQR